MDSLHSNDHRSLSRYSETVMGEPHRIGMRSERFLRTIIDNYVEKQFDDAFLSRKCR